MKKKISESSALETRSERAFRRWACVILIALVVISISPFLLIVMASITEESTLIKNGYSFFPEKLSANAYTYMWGQKDSILKAYGVSFFVTIVGTILSVAVTAMLAYPLSRKSFKHRNLISFFVFFTMLFNGGIVPAYIMWTRYLHVQNTLWALILPNYFVTAFNVFLVRNYFNNSIPKEMVEAAQIDGASEFTIFARVMIPLSVPVLATVSIFTGLAYWNDWTNSLYYIQDTNLYSIQYYLIALMQNIRALASGNASITSGAVVAQLPSVSIRMALAVVGALPLLVAFPFFQKYLIKGVVMGGVKE